MQLSYHEVDQIARRVHVLLDEAAEAAHGAPVQWRAYHAVQADRLEDILVILSDAERRDWNEQPYEQDPRSDQDMARDFFAAMFGPEATALWDEEVEVPFDTGLDPDEVVLDGQLVPSITPGGVDS